MHARQMLETHPQARGEADRTLIRGIEACYDCAQACAACADACLAEENAESLTECIRLCLDCADLCVTAGVLATRRGGGQAELVRQMLGVCATACRLCGEECARHGGHHAHCGVCAEVCRACEAACRAAAEALH